MSKLKRVAAVDIGSTKICCMIAEVDPVGKIEIKGFGTAPPDGFRLGVVISLDKAIDSVARAIEDAEKMAQCRFRNCQVFTSITGDHIKYLSGLGAVPVSRPTKGIQPRDVEDVIRQAQTIRLPNDEQILHVIPTQFIVDGQKGVRNPLGLFGVRLEVEALLIIGAVTAIENLYRVLERLEVRSRVLVLQSLATSFAVCDEQDKELGIVVVDIGGVMDISIYREGEIRFTKLLPVGAANITKDVAIGLRTSYQEAERVKREKGVAMAGMVERDEALTIEDASGRGPKEVSRRLLASIIEPRVEELLNLADSEVRKSGLGDGLSAGMILTGGGALLPGIDILAEQICGMPVKIGRPDRVNGPREITQNPAFSTAVGLIKCAVEGKGRQFHQLPPPGLGQRLWDDIKGWFS
ncbi:MAG: cell division protein FtsA [candidate division WOR-3 bacterium]|jgi:cell division protein FtsA|nr:cell division protein FtsA [candidate division WOR-3 bacterium]MCR4422992.1 cell division protein FtsA [candidate division WOR-3 bacterium]MDH7518331.1 cell division protein FtsA [bacterium]